MRILHSEVEIDAPAEQVWQLLTDFASFPQWNPFIRQINGEAQEGAWLEVYVAAAGGGGIKTRPTILRIKPNHELCWFEYKLIPGLFDGEYRFIIEPLGSNRVRFVQRGIFSGLFGPFLAHRLGRKIWGGFEAMNQALKIRAEQVKQMSS